MIIKELNLIGFGQFNNKVIELKDGLNIIYGENEAGKTTIHNFINGMFYGFLKPYAKRTIYLDEHSKYDPWNSSRYGGIIKFTYDGKKYRIERDFTKNNESTNVILDDTGGNITNSIDTGNSGRILQPGYHFFGFNDAVFSNTLSIKQLGNKTEDSLANEVRDRLVNVSTTLDDNLSIEKATESLNKSIKDIGTVRATTSPYGIKSQKLDKLKSQREGILSLKDNYQSLLSDKENHDKGLSFHIEKLRGLEKRLEDANILSKNKLYLEAKNLKKSIKDLELKAKSYEKYKDLSMEDYSRAISLNSTIENIDDKIREYENTLINIQNKIEELEIKTVEENQSMIDIESDYNKYEELEEEKGNLRLIDYENQMQFLERDRNENKSTKKKLNFVSNMGIVLILLSIVFRSISIFLVITATIVGIFILIYSMLNLRKVKGQLATIDNRIKEIENKESLRSKAIDLIDDSQKYILDKYQVASKLELKRLYDKSQYHILNKEAIIDALRDNRVNKENIIQKIEELKVRNQQNTVDLETILRNNSSTNLDGFKEGLEKKNIYEDTLTEISTKSDILNRVLGNKDIDTLKNELSKYEKDMINTGETMSIDEIKAEISFKKDEINNIKIEISKLEEQIKYLNNEISKLVEIDEEINRTKEFLKDSDDKIEALELAKSTIEEISKDIHHQFAPMINKKVGSIIEDITGGKYSSVKIDNSLEIGVVNPDTKEIVDIKSLSGGTIDQIYFALRFGIVDSINSEALPLILDDCFIQYDDNRLKNILNFLYKKSKERQIILFTCHNRENKILDEMKVKYNLINLNM
ncbi:MAG: AAA family ATPase [Tissierella sp.]|nr:AAA family ATPase [Tissierella sp.]